MADGKFVAYYRVSTKTQGESGLGLEAQQSAVQKFLNGGQWELVAEFTEVETGTNKRKRPELMKALALAKRSKATLVIAKLDRLARNVNFVSGLQDSGVDFVAVDNPHANRHMVNMMAVFAEMEAEAISNRTKAALAAAKERGVKLGRPENLPQGANLKGGQTMKDKAIGAYARIDHLITSLRDKGYSFQKIATHLNDIGETTVKGTRFEAMTVKRIYDRAIKQRQAAVL